MMANVHVRKQCSYSATCVSFNRRRKGAKAVGAACLEKCEIPAKAVSDTKDICFKEGKAGTT
jgi:hypothetical protein